MIDKTMATDMMIYELNVLRMAIQSSENAIDEESYCLLPERRALLYSVINRISDQYVYQTDSAQHLQKIFVELRIARLVLAEIDRVLRDCLRLC